MNIKQDSSPNFGDRRGHVPIMIVNHITDGNMLGAVSWLKNPAAQASSHFVVSRKGEIIQLVALEKMAWCNGTSVTSSAKTYYGHSRSAVVREKATNANYFTVSIEHEAFSSSEGALTPEQLSATVELHNHIIKEVERIYKHRIIPSKDTIIGHNIINPITKPNCPGKNFPLDKIVEEVIKSLAGSPPISPDTEDWKEKLGNASLSALHKRGIVDNIKFWEDKLREPAENWLVFALMERILEEKNKQ